MIKKLGGTVEDTELIDGLIFTQKSCNVNGPKRIEKAKIGLIQFCISPPKTDVRIVIQVYSLSLHRWIINCLSFLDGS